VRGAADRLRPYVPRIATDWLTSNPGRTHLEVEGTLLFSDISGFTRLTERLARRGKAGAEEIGLDFDEHVVRMVRYLSAVGPEVGL